MRRIAVIFGLVVCVAAVFSGCKKINRPPVQDSQGTGSTSDTVAGGSGASDGLPTESTTTTPEFLGDFANMPGGSCFSAEECPLIRFTCADGFEYFSDSSQASCACGCRPVQDTDTLEQTENSPAEESESESNPQTSFVGEVLAGTISPVIDFNQDDYSNALSAGKNIVLYFYASWCPECREEIPHLYAAFNAVNNASLVAFRVNFNDSETDDAEKELAREYGVAYQHTKVFLKNGMRILKSPETWDEDRYRTEIDKVF